MRSILYLGGLGACPHKNTLQIKLSEIEFDNNIDSLLCKDCKPLHLTLYGN